MDVQAGDLLIGWRSNRGIYFEGGTAISVTIPMDKQIGPFHLHKIGIALDWKDAISATGCVTRMLASGRCTRSSKASV